MGINSRSTQLLVHRYASVQGKTGQREPNFTRGLDALNRALRPRRSRADATTSMHGKAGSASSPQPHMASRGRDLDAWEAGSAAAQGSWRKRSWCAGWRAACGRRRARVAGAAPRRSCSARGGVCGRSGDVEDDVGWAGCFFSERSDDDSARGRYLDMPFYDTLDFLDKVTLSILAHLHCVSGHDRSCALRPFSLVPSIVYLLNLLALHAK